MNNKPCPDNIMTAFGGASEEEIRNQYTGMTLGQINGHLNTMWPEDNNTALAIDIFVWLTFPAKKDTSVRLQTDDFHDALAFAKANEVPLWDTHSLDPAGRYMAGWPTIEEYEDDDNADWEEVELVDD